MELIILFGLGMIAGIMYNYFKNKGLEFNILRTFLLIGIPFYFLLVVYFIIQAL